MDPSRQLHNIALIGFMGTGKSSVGHAVSALLQFGFVDTDVLIEEQTGKSIARIFAEEGEAEFRRCEAAVVQRLAGMRSVVIATGGGLAANAANLASLKSHALTIGLWASPEVIWERVSHQTHRPLLKDPEPLEKIRRLLDERAPFYREADVLLNTEWRSIKEVAHQVAIQFRLARKEAAVE